MIEITSTLPEFKIRAYTTGEIVISAPLARIMDIDDGDCVKIFMCDGGRHNTSEMYIAKDKNGLRAKRRKKDRSLRIYSKQATDLLLNGCEKGVFRIGESVTIEGKELHTIIYKRNYAAGN